MKVLYTWFVGNAGNPLGRAGYPAGGPGLDGLQRQCQPLLHREACRRVPAPGRYPHLNFNNYGQGTEAVILDALKHL